MHQKVYATGKSTNVRSMPNIASDILGKATDKIGFEYVRTTPTHNGYKWFVVNIGKAQGFIREDVGKIVTETPIEPSKFTYILDPGHGGINPATNQYVTPGKRSPKLEDGSVYFEGVGNRQIAKRVADKLRDLNIKFAFTVSPSDWQDTGLSTRVNRANSLHAATPCVLISLHSNASGNGSVFHAGQGYEVFTTPGQTKSDTYANIWFEEMSKEFPTMKGRPDVKDGDHDKEERFTMLGTRCPAFLIEMAFHTNRAEVDLLRTPEGQERMANVIVRTIQRIEKLN